MVLQPRSQLPTPSFENFNRQFEMERRNVNAAPRSTAKNG